MTGHKVLMDGPTEGGGHDLGPRPMEMLLLGTGACSSYDVISILRKARQDVVSCEVEVSSERAKTEPKVFTDIHIHFKVTGKDLKEKHVLRTPFSAGNRMPISSAMMEITTNSSISVKPRRRSAVTDIV